MAARLATALLSFALVAACRDGTPPATDAGSSVTAVPSASSSSVAAAAAASDHGAASAPDG